MQVFFSSHTFFVETCQIFFLERWNFITSQAMECADTQGCLLDESENCMKINLHESVSFPVNIIEDKKLNIVDGNMQYMFDEDGCSYLDAFSGIATLCCGHCHPDIVEVMVNQAKRIQHSTIIYLNNAIVDFAQALASKMPGDLKVVFFTNYGTEANEMAVTMADFTLVVMISSSL